jgi:uncharacterized damage-inducible protein DinB
MATYNGWMNQRLYQAAATLPDAEIFADRGAFFASLFDTMSHIAVGDLIWLHRFAHLPGLSELATTLADLPNPSSLRERVAHTLPELSALRTRLDAIIIDMANRLTEQQLSQTLDYENTLGQKQAKNFGLLLQHFFNHQTHHRGQATTLLFQAGVDIGVTDLNALIASEV